MREIFLSLFGALLVVPVSAQPKASGGPVKAEVVVLKSEPITESVATVGTLRANESVVIVPELSRRLTKILVEEGSDARAGQLLFKLDDSELQAEMKELDAKLKLSEANKQRASNLLPSAAISRQQFESLQSEVVVLEAQRATLAVQIAKTEIHAPFNGKVGIRQVSEGALVTPTTPLVTLQDLSKLKVDFPLPERYASMVRTGQKFTFTVAGHSAQFSGTVTVIEPEIAAATRSLLVRGVCEKPDGLLPGGFAEVTLELDGKADGLMVPSQAIVPSPRGESVFVIKDGKAQLQAVEVGMRTEDRVQLLRGVNAGDTVAVTNLLRLRPGVEVVAATP